MKQGVAKQRRTPVRLSRSSLRAWARRLLAARVEDGIGQGTPVALDTVNQQRLLPRATG
jgi:hypothetical protein